MPSKTRYWFHHCDDISALHITSDDPRRAGLIDTAFYDSDVHIVVAMYKWRIRHGRIENNEGKSLLSVIAAAYKLGSIQIEPNADFTRRNFRHRTGLIGGNMANIGPYISTPEGKQALWNARNLPKNFDALKYKNRQEWVELIVEVEDSAKIAIKVNKFMVQHVPKRLCLRMQRKSCTLFLCPTRKQMRRRRHFNDHRHGMSLARHLLDKFGEGACKYDYTRSDLYDFRLREDGKYTTSIAPINNYHRVKDGVVLEVIHPQGYASGIWGDTYRNLYPKVEILGDTDERRLYYLLDDSVAEAVREIDWYICKLENYVSIRSKAHLDDDFKRVPSDRLERFVASIAGLQVRNVVVPSRLSTYYKRAIEKDNLKARAKFENTIASDVTTANRMFTKEKFIKFRQIHADKYVAIPELDIIALDVRHESLRIGGKATNREIM